MKQRISQIDHRASELDMTRSQYLRSLARTDLAKSSKDKEHEPALPGLDHHHHHEKAA